MGLGNSVGSGPSTSPGSHSQVRAWSGGFQPEAREDETPLIPLKKEKEKWNLAVSNGHPSELHIVCGTPGERQGREVEWLPEVSLQPGWTCALESLPGPSQASRPPALPHAACVGPGCCPPSILQETLAGAFLRCFEPLLQLGCCCLS